ncbi:hypothetical protein ACA910_004729 [Epithemia clementina (nom. ined.)]
MSPQFCASAGAKLAVNIATAVVSAADLFEKGEELNRCKEDCTSAPTPQPTPLLTPAPTPQPTRPPGSLSGVFEDPHLSTFDRLRFDCQAAGGFTTLTSLESSTEFMIQERFTAVNSNICSQASVSTGLAIENDSVRVQISTPRVGGGSGSLNSIASCPIDFYVGGVSQEFGHDLGTDAVTVSVSSTTAVIEFTNSFVSVSLIVRQTNSFGCHFLVQVFIPTRFRSNETVLGLLATPNGDRSDDWIDPSGNPIVAPKETDQSFFSQSYQCCVENWCINDPIRSLFTYGPGESFAAINQCSEDYVNEIESAVQPPPPPPPPDDLVQICGTNLFCLVDGVCGNLDDARNALADQQLVEDAQEEANPSPSVVPSTSTAPSSVPRSIFKVSVEPSSQPSKIHSGEKGKKSKPDDDLRHRTARRRLASVS